MALSRCLVTAASAVVATLGIACTQHEATPTPIPTAVSVAPEPTTTAIPIPTATATPSLTVVPTPTSTATPAPTLAPPTSIPTATPAPTLRPTATPGGVPRPFTLIVWVDSPDGGIVAQGSWTTTLPDGRRVHISATPPAVRTMPEPRQTVWAEGDEISMVALVNDAKGFEFAEWSGDCVGTSQSCKLIMDSSKEAAAHFNPS